MRKKKLQVVGRPTEDSAFNARELILKAYFEISRQEGMEAVTLQKIAAYSGLASNTVRYHFNMQGLSLSKVALDYVSEKTYEFLEAGMIKARAKKDFDPVLAYLHLTFDWLTLQPVQASFLVYYYYLSSTKVDLSIPNKELVEIAQQRITGLIFEGLGMRKYDFDVTVPKLSRQIHMTLMGACMIMATSRDKAYALEHKSECIELCVSLLGIGKG